VRPGAEDVVQPVADQHRPRAVRVRGQRGGDHLLLVPHSAVQRRAVDAVEGGEESDVLQDAASSPNAPAKPSSSGGPTIERSGPASVVGPAAGARRERASGGGSRVHQASRSTSTSRDASAPAPGLVP